MANKKIIAQGAEAVITLENNIITKNRIPKSYRHPRLDKKIRTHRTKSEAKLLTKANKLTNIPAVISQDKFNINMNFINGDRLSETLNTYPEAKQFKIMQQLGQQTAKLHNNNIIHGDLTTSNIILHTQPMEKPQPITNLTKGGMVGTSLEPIFIIDFGLGFISARIEDKAVDIHLIKQALEAKHFQNHEQLFKKFLIGYNQYKEIKKVLEQLKKVESRGRYKG